MKAMVGNVSDGWTVFRGIAVDIKLKALPVCCTVICYSGVSEPVYVQNLNQLYYNQMCIEVFAGSEEGVRWR